MRPQYTLLYRHEIAPMASTAIASLSSDLTSDNNFNII